MVTRAAPYLEKLEGALDLDWERQKLGRWKRVLAFEPQDEPFAAHRAAAPEAQPGEWPRLTINQALADPEAMLLHQLGEVYRQVCRRQLTIPSIRANYGTGILPSVLGAELFWMEEQLETLPTARALSGGDPFEKLLAGGEPELARGQGAQVFEAGQYFLEALAAYPKIREAVWIYHPDLQGPVDVLELLVGGEMFTAFYDRPEVVKQALELVTRTYIRFLDRWFERIPRKEHAGCFAHWGLLCRGPVMLRDDSLVNLSDETYREFVKPYDDRILARFGGGAIHFCGKADHCVERMTGTPELTAVHLSQPELNDMPRVLAATVGRGKVLMTGKKAAERGGLDLTRGVVLL